MFPTKMFFSLLLIFLSAQLVAQTPALTTTASEVVVTGSKFARFLGNSPEPVTVIDSATIARATDLSQLLNEQAGIVINGAYANPGKDKSLFMRNAGNAFTIILIDGQPVLDPSSLGGAVDLRLLSLDGIDRIEILRGAKSLLYGSDAVAGVINLITKQGSTGPASKRPTLHLRAAAQSIPSFEAGIALSGQTKKLDYRLGYDRFQTRGISEALAPEGNTQTFDDDGATRENINASLTYRPIPGLSIRPALRLASFDGDYDAGSFQDGANTYENDLLLPSLAFDYTTGKTITGARYSYTKSDRVFTDENQGPFAFNGVNQQADVYTTIRNEKGTYLTGGLQYRRESLTGEEVVMNRELTDVTTISPYLQAGSRVGDNLLLEGGLRYNSHDIFGGLLNFSAAASLPITNSLTTRLSFSNAFQSPTLDQLGGPFGANPDLEPQRATSLELGATLADPKGTYEIGLNLFNRRVTDLINFGPAFTYQNLGELVDNGLELTARGRLSDHFHLNANLTYVSGTLTQDVGNGPPVETKEFFRRPRTTGLLGLTYNAKERFTARLSAQYTGERPDVFFDAGFQRFEVELKPYLLINAYAEYRLLMEENLRIFVDGINLTNSDFVEVTGFSTLGATVRIGASLRL
jgi:vitamin B12 transporter